MRLLRITLVSLLSVSVCSSMAQAAITIVSALTKASVDASLGDGEWDEAGTSIPAALDPFHLDAIDGEAHSRNVINWSSIGGETIFAVDMYHQRLGTFVSYASTESFSDIFFEVDETSSYAVSGYYNVTDVGENESGAVQQSVYLIDYWAGADDALSFSGAQISRNTHNEQFILGDQGGDWVSNFSGSLTGTLTKGHLYGFSFVFDIYQDGPDSGASAVGNITLKIRAIPEPSSIAMLSMVGLVGAVKRRRRFQRR